MGRDSNEGITELLNAVARGDAAAREVLFDRTYQELRALAGSLFQGQGAGHTLQATAIVHEVFLKLVAAGADPNYENRRHFLGIAAKAMRHVLRNHARDKRAQKRGGSRVRVTLHAENVSDLEPAFDALELDDALAKLEAVDPTQARIVELRFYGGLTFDEVADTVGMSATSVRREWRMARAELLLMLDEGDRPDLDEA